MSDLMTPTTNGTPTDAAAAIVAPVVAEPKIKTITHNGVVVTIDWTTPTSVVAAAIALESMDEETRGAYDQFVAAGVTLPIIAGLIYMGLTKDLKAKLKELEKPDHDAAWRTMDVEYGAGNYTVLTLLNMMGDIAKALNISSATYNTLHSTSIKPVLIEGGTSGKRAKPDTNTKHDRSYVVLGSALVASGITAVHFTAAGKEHSLSLRKANAVDPTNGADVEYKNGGAWANIGTLRSAFVNAHPAGTKNIDNSWARIKVTQHDGTVMTIADWYDTNCTTIEKESVAPTE